MEKELSADGYLNKLLENPFVLGYVVLNTDGIPMRYDGEGMTHKVAVHYSALILDFWIITKKTFQKQIKDNFLLLSKNNLNNGITSSSVENDIDYIRMRTNKNTELIITSFGEFVLMCIQKCKEEPIIESEVIEKKPAEAAV